MHYCHSGKKPANQIETLVPGFYSRMDRALDIQATTPPDMFSITWKTYRYLPWYGWCRLQLVSKLLERAKARPVTDQNLV